MGNKKSDVTNKALIMSLIKKSYHNIYPLRPVNRDTALAVSGEDKDRESKPKVIEMPKPPTPIAWKGLLICPMCGCDVLTKNMKKHILRHKKAIDSVREA
jgi:hypothetical protein